MNTSATLRQMPSVRVDRWRASDDRIPNPRAPNFTGFARCRLRAAARRHPCVPVDADPAPAHAAAPPIATSCGGPGSGSATCRGRLRRRRIAAGARGDRSPQTHRAGATAAGPGTDRHGRRADPVIACRRQRRHQGHGDRRDAAPDAAAHGRRCRRTRWPRCSGSTPAGPACVRSPRASNSTRAAGASSPCRSVEAANLWPCRETPSAWNGSSTRRPGRSSR